MNARAPLRQSPLPEAKRLHDFLPSALHQGCALCWLNRMSPIHGGRHSVLCQKRAEQVSPPVCACYPSHAPDGAA